MFAVLFVSLFLTSPWEISFVQRLEYAVGQGQLTQSQALRYQELAVTTPEALPLKWREVLLAHPLPKRSGTALLVDAYQKEHKGHTKTSKGLPVPLAFYLDSANYPLRVYYNSPDLEHKAQVVLAAAEWAWEFEINQAGFWAPPILSSEGRYRFYLQDAGGDAAGYCAPIGDVPETPHDDCYTYIVIESKLQEESLYDTVAHELSHATQGAMDCLEPVVHWENTSVFMECAIAPDSCSNNAWFGYYFQSKPYLSISENRSPYWYGGYLWSTYLAHTYGDGAEDAVFIREVWEGAVQETNPSGNTITYTASLRQKLQEQGSTFNEAFHRFSAARYFVDNMYQDTPSSLPYGSRIFPVPPLVHNLQIDVPLSARPGPDQLPKLYGVNYFLLEKPPGYKRRTTVTLMGQRDGPSWALQIIALEDLENRLTKEATGISVSLEYDPEEMGSVIAVVEQLGGEEFDPVRIPVEGERYRLSVVPAVPLPTLNLVFPSVVMAGQEQEFTLYGGNFQEGATVAFLPENGIQVLSTTFVSSGTLKVVVRIPKGALTGPMSVRVRNPDEGEVERAEAFRIEPPAKRERSSGGCNQRGEGGQPSLLLLLLFGLLFVRIWP